MSAKSALAFQPAPRPQPRTTPEETERLLAATQDLGFGRVTAAAPSTAAAPEAATLLGHAANLPAEDPSPVVRSLGKLPEVQAPPELRRAPALKFDLPDGLWDELRMQALRRRVTVKYLVLEALADRGYAIDLAAVPEDGRRLR